ncbi:LTA synthase family protein [Saccharibacillus sacchari]|uniref:LTA synthase family protein n=1 Tax=Saccharibacillus sacchari TaxID=456493 RepID=UPI0004B0E71C|nr:LTA synthase family protein [Saccharibacillus sacchari]
MKKRVSKVQQPFIWFSVILLVKSLVVWSAIFTEEQSWGVMITELPFFVVIFVAIEWFASKRKVFYYMLANLMITIIYFSVLMYYKYYGVVATYRALGQVGKLSHVEESTFSLLTPYYLFLFADILIFFFLFLLPKSRSEIKTKRSVSMNRKTLSLILSLALVVCLFQVWPNRASMNEVKKAESMGILNYELYKIIEDATAKKELIASDRISQPIVDGLTGTDRAMASTSELSGVDKSKNLLIIQMESLQNFVIGLKVDGREVTPNLNRLIQDSTYFPNFYTNAGAGTTSDAEFVVNTSFYAPSDGAATSSAYMNKNLPGLPRLLHEKGYDKATFHTNTVKFWNRDRLYPALGFDRYYDQAFYGSDDYIAFGASDERLYDKTLLELKRMNENEQPFYAMVISMSAHHPYHLPSDKYRMELPEAYADTLLGDYLQAQSYADFALGKFIDGLKTSGVWEDSLVVLYGDHQGLPLYSLTGREKEQLHELIGHEYGYTDMFNIPLVLRSPSGKLPDESAQLGAQIDILPTVARLLDVSLDDDLHFGQDLLQEHSSLIPLVHYLPVGSYLEDQSIYVTGNQYTDGERYLLQDNAMTQPEASERKFRQALQLHRLSDSYLLQLPDRIE